MIQIKTTLKIDWVLPIYDFFEENTTKDKMKKEIEEHITRLLKYHNIPETAVKVVKGDKEQVI